MSNVRNATASVPIVGISVRNATSLVASASAVIRDSTGTLITWFGSPTAPTAPTGGTSGSGTPTLSATYVYGSITRNVSAKCTSQSVTVTPAGGTAPYTISWARTAPDAHSWTIDAPTAMTTSFSTLVAPDTEWIATFVGTVTDANGLTGTTPTVTADCVNTYVPGGFA